MNNLSHPFDLTTHDDGLDLFAEELPEQVQLVSDCASSLGSFSCCGTTASLACMGSIISCGS